MFGIKFEYEFIYIFVIRKLIKINGYFIFLNLLRIFNFGKNLIGIVFFLLKLGGL